MHAGLKTESSPLGCFKLVNGLILVENEKLLRLKLGMCIDKMCYTSGRGKRNEVPPDTKTEVFLDD